MTEKMDEELKPNVPIRVGGFRIYLKSDSAVLLGGRLALQDGGREVAARLDELHHRVVTRKVGHFVVDVREVDFVNSSAIRFFVDWINKAKKNDYRLSFKIDPGVTWQRLSFSVLKSLAPETVEIHSLPAEVLEHVDCE